MIPVCSLSQDTKRGEWMNIFWMCMIFLPMAVSFMIPFDDPAAEHVLTSSVSISLADSR